MSHDRSWYSKKLELDVCGMNRTLSYGAQVLAHLDPSKGVDASGLQDGGHGSRNPLRSVQGVEDALKSDYEREALSACLETENTRKGDARQRLLIAGRCL